MDNMHKLKVLYIHSSGIYGGASKSLAELINAFPRDKIYSIVLTPDGSAAKIFSRVADEVFCTRGISQFDNTKTGYYRGFRWLILLRELYYFPFTVAAIRKIRKIHPDIDIIHYNEITHFVTTAKLIKGLFRDVPVLLHIRSLQRLKPNSARTRWITGLVEKYSDRIICIDGNVFATLQNIEGVEIIHNGFKINENILNEDNVPFSFTKKKFTALFLGNLLYKKGIMEFLEAAKLSRINDLEITFLIVGITNRNAGFRSLLFELLAIFSIKTDMTKKVHQYIRHNNLNETICIYPFTNDLPAMFSQIDVLCFPSHLDSPGRPIFEAAFFKKPSIIACESPSPDTFINENTGISISKPDPLLLFEAIKRLYDNPDEVKEMGENAYKLALENFDVDKNSRQVLEIYKQITNLQDK
jgi:glycosyltransferase involved in cell wall biosynthesis